MATQNGQKIKTILKTQFVKETENMQKPVFSFQFLKVNEKTHLINEFVLFNELILELKS